MALFTYLVWYISCICPMSHIIAFEIIIHYLHKPYAQHGIFAFYQFYFFALFCILNLLIEFLTNADYKKSYSLSLFAVRWCILESTAKYSYSFSRCACSYVFSFNLHPFYCSSYSMIIGLPFMLRHLSIERGKEKSNVWCNMIAYYCFCVD